MKKSTIIGIILILISLSSYIYAYFYWMSSLGAEVILLSQVLFLGWIINYFGVDCEENIVSLKFPKMPCLKPIKIPTANKGFWSSIIIWLLVTRKWVVVEDWEFSLNGKNYIIPEGFVFNGANVPKFLRIWLSPVGIMLIGSLVHDFIYQNQYLLVNEKDNNKNIQKELQTTYTYPTEHYNRKEADELFRDINIEQNGIHVLNWIVYIMVRLGGIVAWKRSRNNDTKNNRKDPIIIY